MDEQQERELQNFIIKTGVILPQLQNGALEQEVKCKERYQELLNKQSDLRKDLTQRCDERRKESDARQDEKIKEQDDVNKALTARVRELEKKFEGLAVKVGLLMGGSGVGGGILGFLADRIAG